MTDKLGGERASVAPEDEAAKTAKWAEINVGKFKRGYWFEVKPEASASTQPENLPDDDKQPIAPTVDEATGLSIQDKEQMDSIWEFIEKAPPGWDKAAWGRNFAKFTNSVV